MVLMTRLGENKCYCNSKFSNISDGTNNAWLLQVTSDNDRHYLRVGSSTTSTVSISIFAKKGTTDYAYFFCGGTTNIQAIFDLSDGSITDSGAIGSGSSLTSASSISLGMVGIDCKYQALSQVHLLIE